MSIESPSYFASFVKSTKKTSHNIGVSSGIGEGIFVTKANIGTVTGKKILYTEVLSPDIVQYFDSIVGIVSNSGGMLSHLAIMAREAKIPVVVTNSSKTIPFGKIGSINGLTGELKVL
jgi:pyruvate,water dikinase